MQRRRVQDDAIPATLGSGSPRPLIDRTFPWEDAAAAIRYVETEHPRGKVVLTIA